MIAERERDLFRGGLASSGFPRRRLTVSFAKREGAICSNKELTPSAYKRCKRTRAIERKRETKRCEIRGSRSAPILASRDIGEPLQGRLSVSSGTLAD